MEHRCYRDGVLERVTKMSSTSKGNPSGPVTISDLARALSAAEISGSTENNNRKIKTLLEEIASSGIEFEDPRLNYITIQIDKETWKNLLTFVKENP